MRNCFVLMLLTLVEGFVVNTPIRNYKKYIDNNVVKVLNARRKLVLACCV